jgi:hypothetical protein
MDMQRSTYYVEKQREWCRNVVELNKFGSRAGFVDVDEEKRVAGNLYDYFDITEIVEHAGMSIEDANNLLEVIKRVTRRNGKQAPVPANYRTMKDTVLKKIRYRILPVSKMNLKFPIEMFGNLVLTMKSMSFVFVDIALLIAEKLLTVDAGTTMSLHSSFVHHDKTM